jgi:uncharacterized protein (DUF1800 family)
MVAGGALAAALTLDGALGPALAAETGALPPADDLTHLLGRATFGFRLADWEEARAIGYEGWLERQLAPESIDDSALDAALAASLPTLAMSGPELLALAADPARRNEPLRELLLATLYRAIASRRQLFEVMVEFWSNHFSVNARDGVLGVLKAHEDRAVIRPHALGRFAELVAADARSPAMLVYLDNVANVRGGANENYARELLELHTLGVDGGYTETDVQETARVFTGWSYERATGAFRFQPARHDYGRKTVLGHAFRAGRGVAEGDELLALLARHESTARFVAAKLCRRFVADQPSEAAVGEVAAAFATSGGDLRATLRALFFSGEFLAARDAKLKRPVEYAASVLRAAGAAVTELGWRALSERLRALGQLPFTWPAPDGFPDAAGAWTSASAMMERLNLALTLADGSAAAHFPFSTAPLVGGADTPVALVDTLVDRLLHRPILAADREALIAAAAGGRPSSRRLSGREREAAARTVIGLLLAARYFQLR